MQLVYKITFLDAKEYEVVHLVVDGDPVFGAWSTPRLTVKREIRSPSQSLTDELA
jgi:hypothetical protein